MKDVDILLSYLDIGLTESVEFCYTGFVIF